MTVKRVIFTLLWMCVIVSGICLGTWQVKRLAWKNEWLAHIDAAYTAPLYPLTATQMTVIGDPSTFFIRGMIQGTFDPDYTFFVTPRVHGNVVGGHFYQLLRLVDGGALWVNMGFAPTAPAPVTGDFFGPVSVYVPDYRGFAQTAQGQAVFAAPILDVAGTDIPNVVAASEVSFDGVASVAARPTPPNNHFGYAVFWFGMSGFAFLFGLYMAAAPFLKKKKSAN